MGNSTHHVFKLFFNIILMSPSGIKSGRSKTLRRENDPFYHPRKAFISNNN